MPVKTEARFIWNSSFQAVPLPFVSRLAPSKLLAPCYHLVSDDPPAHIRHLFRCRSVDEFKTELDWLLKRFKPVSLDELYQSVVFGEPLPDRSMFLSFDDGLRECIDTVAPICRAKGVPVTFFLATGFIGNRSLCYRHKASLLIEHFGQSNVSSRSQGSPDRSDSAAAFRAFVLNIRHADAHLLDQCAGRLELDFNEYLAGSRPYVDESDVARLIQMGFSIGGHSVDHPPYADLTTASQLAQTEECLRDLKAKFGQPLNTFAFPFVADGVSEQFIREAFSRGLADLMFYTGALRSGHDRRMIWRFGVESGSGTLAACWKKEVGSQQLDRLLTAVRSITQ